MGKAWDKLEKAIVREFGENPRVNLTSLGRKLNVHPNVISYRIEQLGVGEKLEKCDVCKSKDFHYGESHEEIGIPGMIIQTVECGRCHTVYKTRTLNVPFGYSRLGELE